MTLIAISCFIALLVLHWLTCSIETKIAKNKRIAANHRFFCQTFQTITSSTPRTQTSATPSLKNVKQSTQAWNSVAYCFLCPFPENFMNVHPSGIKWCCQQTRTQENGKRIPVSKGYTDQVQNVTDCFWCHSQHILKISWKSTHRFYRGVAEKHARGT